jgi:hypothetical protein
LPALGGVLRCNGCGGRRGGFQLTFLDPL